MGATFLGIAVAVASARSTVTVLLVGAVAYVVALIALLIFALNAGAVSH
jgi:hypothetical protein